MKLTSVIPKLVLLIFTSILAATGPAPAGEATTPGAARIDVMKLHSAPDGNDLVILQLDSWEQRVNIHVKDGSAKCIASSDPRLNGMEGKFESIGNGVFRIFFQSDFGHKASQFWFFHKDGSAAVKEIPDRGEKQTATPVTDESIDPPKAR